ncbi:MAG: hypothetical protein WAN36_00890 [Calditrichia bacterium]
MMQERNLKFQETETAGKELTQHYENILSYIRSRLNIINTSVYLLQSEYTENRYGFNKYFETINAEMESIRRLINE